MLRKIVSPLKKVGIALTMLFVVIACEKDLEDIAIGLVDNEYFSTGDSIFEVLAYTVHDEPSRVDNNWASRTPLYLLGINKDENFGYKKSALISQAFLPLTGVDFGDNAVIDTVILDIPYYATRSLEDQNATDPDTGEIIEDEDGNPISVPDFTLDSVYGNRSQAFNIKINELETYLNVLDPEDPTKNKSYYSDKDYELNSELFNDDFKTNRNDTVLYVLRKNLDDDPNTIDQIDTIKAQGSVPSMKFSLDENFFQQNFIDNFNQSDFDSNDNFVRFFKGFYIDANGDDGALINVAAANARFTIYYTNDEIVNELGSEDLNGNGVFGESGVTVREAHRVGFPFGGVRTGKYENNVSGYPVDDALLNPDMVNGEKKLYVQGAAGTKSIIKLFSNETLEDLRSGQFLINEANLTIYLDDNQNQEVPRQLFLYNYDDNSTLVDYRVEGASGVYGGRLQYDDDGNPESYKFRITFFVSDLVKSTNTEESTKLALRNYLTTDVPTVGVLDTIIQDFNWIPKGAVLKGNLPSLEDKRMKLQIYYTIPEQ